MFKFYFLIQIEQINTECSPLKNNIMWIKIDYEILVFHCPGHIFVTPLCSDNARNLNVNIKQKKIYHKTISKFIKLWLKTIKQKKTN